MATEQTARWHKGDRPRAGKDGDKIVLATDMAAIRMPVSEAETLTAELMALLGWERVVKETVEPVST